MYTAKLFDDLVSFNAVTIIDDRKSKTLFEALQNAINRTVDFDVPGFDAIVRIDIYNDGVYVNTSVLKDGSFITSNFGKKGVF